MQKSEEAFEAHIEEELIELHGYHKGEPKDLDKATGINTAELLAFLEATQQKELCKLFKDYRTRVPEVLAKRLGDYGTLDALKNELKVDNISLTLFYPRPSASDSEAAKALYLQNRFTVTRQQTYSLSQPGQEIDMVLFVNGLPIVTIELKQPWTGKLPALTAWSNTSATATRSRRCSNSAAASCTWPWTKTRCGWRHGSRARRPTSCPSTKGCRAAKAQATRRAKKATRQATSGGKSSAPTRSPTS